MKQLTCEMCGSTDLMKDGGVFVCQVCGIKYSVEEAKKMMVEGTVEVQGTVKVDNSAFVEKYLMNARRARSKEDWEEMEKYYNMVEQNDPSNIEAIFYSAYGKAKMSLIANDIYMRQQAFKVLTNCVSIIDDNYELEDAEENKAAIIDIAKDINDMMCSEFVYTQTTNGYGQVTKTNVNETYQLFMDLSNTFLESIGNIIEKDNQDYLHEVIIEHRGLVARLTYASASTVTMNERIVRQEKEYLRKKHSDEFWADRQDEKIALETEQKVLESQVAQIKAAFANDRLEANKEEITKKIEGLKSQKSLLGIFDGKKKELLNKQIKDEEEALKRIEAEIEEINNRIKAETSSMNDRIAEIKARLYWGR